MFDDEIYDGEDFGTGALDDAEEDLSDREYRELIGEDADVLSDEDYIPEDEEDEDPDEIKKKRKKKKKENKKKRQKNTDSTDETYAENEEAEITTTDPKRGVSYVKGGAVLYANVIPPDKDENAEEKQEYLGNDSHAKRVKNDISFSLEERALMKLSSDNKTAAVEVPEEMTASYQAKETTNSGYKAGGFSNEDRRAELKGKASEKKERVAATGDGGFYFSNVKTISEFRNADEKRNSVQRLKRNELQKSPKSIRSLTEKAKDTEQENNQELKERSYVRKFTAHGEGTDAALHMSESAKAAITYAAMPKGEMDETNAEQQRSFEKAVRVLGTSWEVLGAVGLRAIANNQRDEAKKLERAAYALEKASFGGEMGPEKILDNAKRIAGGNTKDNAFPMYQKHKEKKIIQRKLESLDIDKKYASYIAKHSDEVRDALYAKKALSAYAAKHPDKEHVFAKTKVKGNNVVFISKRESKRQRKLLSSDSGQFFDKHKNGALTKNMIKTYFSSHEDVLFRKMNPAVMSDKDLKRFIKKLESGKIYVKEEYLREALPLLRTYKRAKQAQKKKRKGKNGSIKILMKRGLYRAMDYLRYADDISSEGYRNAVLVINGAETIKVFSEFSIRAGITFVKFNRKLNPALITSELIYKKVIGPSGRRAAKAAGEKLEGTKAVKTVKEAKEGAKELKKKGADAIKRTKPVKAAKKTKEAAKKASENVKKIRNAKSVRTVKRAYRKTKRVYKGVGKVIAISFIPVRAAKTAIGYMYKAYRKVALIVLTVLFVVILCIISLLLFSAIMQSVMLGEATLFESTILDDELPSRISFLKNRDLLKYQEAIDIALGKPDHEESHRDSKGLFPDEALFGVKLYHYGSPDSKDDENAGIYHNDIGGETKNGYHIYFLDSGGNTIGNSTTNIKDVLCLSAVMADNYYDDRNRDKIEQLQGEIFDILNPKPSYMVSELYHKEGNDRFPFEGYTYEQRTYYCNDEGIYNSEDSAKNEGVVFYNELSPRTEKGCSTDFDSYFEDRSEWISDQPYFSDFAPSWSDYAPNTEDYVDEDGNFDLEAYNNAYAAAKSDYDAAYAEAENSFNTAYSEWEEREPDRDDEKYKYCPGHPSPGKDDNEEDEISVSYGYRDINIYVTVLTKEDVYRAFTENNGTIKYKTPKNYECTEFTDHEIPFSLSGSYGDMLSEFDNNDGWKSEKNREWCDELYNNDWGDLYGMDVYSDTTDLPSGKGALSDQQIKEILDGLGDVSEVRQEVVNYALSYVGQISYYYGGKPKVPGFEGNGFGSAVNADYKGRTKKGLDCSGFVSWVYWSVTGIKPPNMNTSGFTTGLGLSKISYSQLKPGDIGFISPPGAKSNHVGIFVGYDETTGRAKWVHCSGAPRNTVVCDTTNMFSIYYRLFD